MRKKVLRLSVFLMLFIIVIGIKTTVQANSINSIKMDIYVDNNGNAKVTETWNCKSTSQTEWYRSYFDLGNSKITDLKVSDKTKEYTTLSSWNTSASFEEKAYKCGLNKVSNGIEICWGKSTYGSNVYTVKYNISGFVAELTDSQMVDWTLIPKEHFASMGSIEIKIYADQQFEDTLDVWGYGNYGGLCYVKNGAIYMSTDGKSLGQSEYMTILVKFPEETFNTSNTLNHDFDYYYDMAEEGSTKYNEEKESISSIIVGIFSLIITILPWIIIAIVVGKSHSSKKYGFKYGEAGKKIPKDVAYYRDIPCNGDIFRAYYIAYQYGLVKNETDILGAIILKWIKTGAVQTEKKESGKIFKKENTAIILNKEQTFDNERESKIFNMLYDASGDGVLENKEFEKWCKRHYTKVLGWFDDILEEQKNKLVTDGLITQEEKQGLFKNKKYTATQDLKDDALKIAGLKRYLLDYTLIKDREAIEVQLFEDYLIYAQMLGIAKQVSKQFKELYPDMIEQTNYGSYDNIIFINYYAARGISSASSARAAAESYSSGGGGFSSGGGGGGSFGGGGGIGSR